MSICCGVFGPEKDRKIDQILLLSEISAFRTGSNLVLFEPHPFSAQLAGKELSFSGDNQKLLSQYCPRDRQRKIESD